MSEPVFDLSLARKVANIARRAGVAILKVYNSDNFGVQEKGDTSPLTLADEASNEVINRGLKRLGLHYPIISEENKEIAYATRKDFTTYWLVDPLDGTKEFIKRNGEFCVNIALVHQQRVVLGVVFVPATGGMFYAAKGFGAWQVLAGKRTRMHAAKYRASDAGLSLVCSRSHMNEETTAFVNQYTEPKLVSQGSSLKFTLVASGQAHIYPRIGPTMEWDTGAPQIIVEEAGGKVVRFDDNSPLLYNKENLLNPYFVVYGNEQK